MFPLSVDEETELELIERGHVDELQKVIERNLDHLRPWMPWAREPTTREGLAAFVGLRLRGHAEGKGFYAAIRHRGRIAGTVGLNIDQRDRAGEIGYWLDRDLQGRGLVTKSVAAVVERCFGELALHRVEIRCAPGNARSRAVPERLGFLEEGTVRDAERLAEDEYHDLVIYGRLATDPGELWPRSSQ